MRDFSFDKSSSNRIEEEIDNNKRYEKRQEKTGIYKPKLSVFHLGSRDYLCIVREYDSLSTGKHKQRQIHELEKVVSNSLSIKIIFAAQQLCILPKKFSISENIISQSLIEKDKEKVSENKKTIKAKAVHNLSGLI